jgi:tetrahydromethanopterin S-methyltransferase subunit G
MTADTLEVRIAHLEGAYEQVDKRLASIESRMGSLERKVDEGFAQLRGTMDTNYRWVIGIILVNWITLMLAILLRG